MDLKACSSAAATPMNITVNNYCNSWISMELRWMRRQNPGSNNRDRNPRKLIKLNTASTLPETIPVYVSADRRDVNPEELRGLYAQCNHSCHRFPETDPESGSVKEIVDMDKLCTALSHSYVLISAFCKPQDIKFVDSGLNSDNGDDNDGADLYAETGGSSVGWYRSNSPEQDRESDRVGLFGALIQRATPVTPANSRLVGFGRAVSDHGLTASIYDIMVIPSLRGMGIGKLIVKRIIRSLTSRGIYDIAALCSEQERLFFKACGFGDDVLGSTTMMYTKTVETSLMEDDIQLTRRLGRKLLLAPPARKPFASSMSTKSV